jgi:hypothetical protein
VWPMENSKQLARSKIKRSTRNKTGKGRKYSPKANAAHAAAAGAPAPVTQPVATATATEEGKVLTGNDFSRRKIVSNVDRYKDDEREETAEGIELGDIELLRQHAIAALDEEERRRAEEEEGSEEESGEEEEEEEEQEAAPTVTGTERTEDLEALLDNLI